MSKEQLIKEVEKLTKQLNRKKDERLSWKKIMHGEIVRGPGYWGTGHFLFYDSIPTPAAVNKLNVVEREVEQEMMDLIPEAERVEVVCQDIIDGGEIGRIKCLKTPDGVHFDKTYINMLNKVAPGFTLEAAQGVAAIIKVNGEMVGCLMPVNSN